MGENEASLLNTSLLIEHANQPREQERQSEDYILVTDGLLGVFDSVGGRDKGRLVSHLAGKVIAAAWRSLSGAERQRPPEQLESVLQALIRQADTAIAELPIPPEHKRPATTAALCALSTHQGQAYATVAHIGDSRVYLLRAGQPLRRLTKDNGYFSFAVRHQQLTEEEALRIEQAEQAEDLLPEQQAHFARRNTITCAVGWSDFPRIQTSSLALFPGDRVLLCTDGIHDNLTDREIEEILLAATDEPGAQSLVNAAMERSQQAHFRAKRDDMSAIVAWYQCSC
jgi:serine/threonine protein phosphatase PrpC